MRYEALLFDVDDTLLDFAAAEERALSRMLPAFGLDLPGAAACYRACNDACWRALERGEMGQEELRYRRFRDFLRAMDSPLDPVTVGDYYMNALSRESILLPGALETLQILAPRAPIAAVTNGIAFIQHGRIDGSPIAPFLSALVISEELGVAKPDPGIVHEALKQLGGIAPDRALLVGDSLTSDIACARNAGADACWVNPTGLARPQDLPIRYEVRSVRELPILLGIAQTH